MKVFKLDARYAGHWDFKYGIKCDKSDTLHQLRVYCWETFGPGASVETIRSYPEITWGWMEDHNQLRFRILFKEEKDAAWAVLAMAKLS